jgi:hypothetical protein
MKIKTWKKSVLNWDSWKTTVERTKTQVHTVVASIKKKKFMFLYNWLDYDYPRQKIVASQPSIARSVMCVIGNAEILYVSEYNALL